MSRFRTSAADLKQCGINHTYLAESRTASKRHSCRVGVCSEPHFPVHTGGTRAEHLMVTWLLGKGDGCCMMGSAVRGRPGFINLGPIAFCLVLLWMALIASTGGGGKFSGLSGRFSCGSRHGWAVAAAGKCRWALRNGFGGIWPREAAVDLSTDQRELGSETRLTS